MFYNFAAAKRITSIRFDIEKGSFYMEENKNAEPKNMQIYFFTRSGRSEHIARQLAVRYETKVRRITDHRNWQGKINYIKAGYMSATNKSLPADYKKPDSESSIAVVFPLWAGTFPPAVKTFIDEVGRENIICVVTSLGSKLKDRQGFINVIDLVGDKIQVPTKL